MRKSQYKILFSLCLLACLFFIIKSYSQASPIDSTFWDLSLPEILSYKTYYMQELEVYQREKQSLIQRGIEDGESLLNTNSDPGIIGDILIRLANLYYYQEKDEYFNQMSQFDDRLMLFEAGELDQVPVEPKVTFKKSLEIINLIDKAVSQSDKDDREDDNP